MIGAAAVTLAESCICQPAIVWACANRDGGRRAAIRTTRRRIILLVPKERLRILAFVTFGTRRWRGYESGYETQSSLRDLDHFHFYPALPRWAKLVRPFGVDS